jgi:predicted KAP-like P-loop ATPase
VNDYLDKLIQVPVRVPRSGVTEVRAFLFMLFAEAEKTDASALATLRDRLEENLRSSWKEEPLSVEQVVAILGPSGKNLASSFDIADRMASLLATSKFVEGNPRIVKRLLNSVRLRATIARRREMPVNEEMVAKFALFERCAEPAAVAKLYSLINEAQQGKPALIIELEQLMEDQEAFDKHCPDEWSTSDLFLWDWFGLKPSLAGQDLRPLVYLSRETTTLRPRSSDLSQSAAESLDRLRKVNMMASPVGKAAARAVMPAERKAVMSELIEGFRSHTEWQRKPEGFTGALLLAEADDTGEAARDLLKDFVRKLPKHSPWLTAILRNCAWFR